MFVFDHIRRLPRFSFFFFNDTATTEIYTLSLHDALPICAITAEDAVRASAKILVEQLAVFAQLDRSEEHTSELQSPDHLVCRLLLEKKKSTQLHDCVHRLNKDAPTYHS